MVQEIANQILDGIKWIIDKINELLFWVAGFVAEKSSVELNNVYLILLAAISLYVASKITMERGLKMLLLGILIFSILWTMGGKI